MEAVIEFQGFKDNQNRFIVKEFALVSALYKVHFMFGPPYGKSRLDSKTQRTVRWLTRHYHKIRWESGEFPYDEEYIRLLCIPFSTLYTRGLEKTKFIQEFHRDVREISGNVNYNGDDVKSDCTFHNCPTAKCALTQALQGYKWVSLNNFNHNSTSSHGERMGSSLSRTKSTGGGDDGSVYHEV